MQIVLEIRYLNFVVIWLTLALEPWLDLAFLALGDSTGAVRADRDEDDEDEDSERPATPPGPPRRWPPPEKGMKGTEGAAEEEEDGSELSPDGPAFSPSSSGIPLSTRGNFGRTASWEFETFSCWTGSELVDGAGGGATWVSVGLWGLESLIGTSVVDASGCDGAGSGWDDGLGMVSLTTTGVIGIAAVSVASPPCCSPCALLFLSKNLKTKWNQQLYYKA